MPDWPLFPPRHRGYLIAGPLDAATRTQLYWSSRRGWVEAADAECFTEADQKFNTLPSGSRWVPEEQVER